MEIVLEPYGLKHVGLLFEAAVESQPELFPFMPWCHPDYTLEEARQFILTELEHFRDGYSFEFAIMSENGLFLGGCGINQLDFVYLRANLGYWVRSTATAQGIATTAVKRLAAWAWENTPLIRLEIVVATGNHGSSRVAEKAGAAFEGVSRSRLMLHGKAHDANVYSLLRSAGF
jgi:RimJ/RimL family protein N-acetyltransferase